jgi:hypothetical protein
MYGSDFMATLDLSKDSVFFGVRALDASGRHTPRGVPRAGGLTGASQGISQDMVGTARRCGRDTGPAIVCGMRTPPETSVLSTPTCTSPDQVVGDRPSWRRRTALAITGVLACALPVVWGLGVIVELIGGTEPDHRFHQVTGQGLLLVALWLVGLVPLLRAGWHGRTPSAAAGLHHLAFVAAALITGALAPGSGALAVGIIAAVTGGLVWLSLPSRPPVRTAVGGLEPLTAPIALLAAGFLTPYVIDQLDKQRNLVDEHAELAHYFDMAWLATALVFLVAIAALTRGTVRLLGWAAAGLTITGFAGLAFLDTTGWSLAVLGLGVLTGAAAALRRRTG